MSACIQRNYLCTDGEGAADGAAFSLWTVAFDDACITEYDPFPLSQHESEDDGTDDGDEDEEEKDAGDGALLIPSSSQPSTFLSPSSLSSPLSLGSGARATEEEERRGAEEEEVGGMRVLVSSQLRKVRLMFTCT